MKNLNKYIGENQLKMFHDYLKVDNPKKVINRYLDDKKFHTKDKDKRLSEFKNKLRLKFKTFEDAYEYMKNDENIFNIFNIHGISISDTDNETPLNDDEKWKIINSLTNGIIKRLRDLISDEKGYEKYYSLLVDTFELDNINEPVFKNIHEGIIEFIDAEIYEIECIDDISNYFGYCTEVYENKEVLKTIIRNSEINSLKYWTRNGGGDIYRYINLPNNIDDLNRIKYEGVGQYWTRRESEASDYEKRDDGVSKDNGSIFIGKPEAININWEHTILKSMWSMQYEMEIEMKLNSYIDITNVKIINDSKHINKLKLGDMKYIKKLFGEKGNDDIHKYIYNKYNYDVNLDTPLRVLI